MPCPCPLCECELEFVTMMPSGNVMRHPWNDNDCVLSGLEFPEERLPDWNRRSPVAEGGGSDPIREEMARALEPLARLEIPKRPQGNAGAYSIFHKSIEAARAALSKHKAPSPPVPSQEGASETGEQMSSPR